MWWKKMLQFHPQAQTDNSCHTTTLDSWGESNPVERDHDARDQGTMI